MNYVKKLLRPAVLLAYAVIVLEILFMISPFAMHFYLAYGPVLNFLDRSPLTSWLTGFFLPHFSQTAAPLLDALHRLAWLWILTGGALFLGGAVPIYWSKFTGRSPVTGGLYRYIRHPQYVGLAVIGFGTVLLWPRFIVLLTYVTMLFLYILLARWEEEQCLERFGDEYAAYLGQTGMFVPHLGSGRRPVAARTTWGTQIAATTLLYLTVIGATTILAVMLRDYSLSKVSAIYSTNAAIISTARLTKEELQAVYRIAGADPAVQKAIEDRGPGNYIIYVVPDEWYLPDLPLDPFRKHRGHYTPEDFDRNKYKVLFTKAIPDQAHAEGEEIVKSAYSRDPLVVAVVDTTQSKVTATRIPPRHVGWGDIPTPMF